MKKSFFKNILNLVSGVPFVENNHVSGKEAIKMQKAYADTLTNKSPLADLPPYMEIAQQLFSEKTEIFQAAVYYLVRIAQNEYKYTDKIIALLKEYAQQAERTDAEMRYLSEQISRLERKISVLP